MKYSGKVKFEHYLLCVQFAKDVINSNLDALIRRGQSNEMKIYEDILLGKMCEFLVFQELEDCTHPDLTVVSSHAKSYDADLKARGFNIHVKSCRRDNKIKSWVFQPNDPLVLKPGKKDLLALCIISNDGNVEFELVRPKNVVYKPPLNPNLNKKVIYLEDLK